MSRRDQIAMTPDEQRMLLESERVIIVASNGPGGWPHLMPLWYIVRDGEVWIYTYGKSQKVKNFERDPRATLMLETGHEYNELRGVMIEAEAEIHTDFETAFETGKDLALRYAEGFEKLGDDGVKVVEQQAKKRVAIRFVPKNVASWDHSKLGGVY